MELLNSLFNSSKYRKIENIRTDGAYGFKDEVGVLFFLIFQTNGKISWILDGFCSSWEVSVAEVLLKLKDLSERANNAFNHANNRIYSNNSLLLTFMSEKDTTNLCCQLKKDGNMDVKKNNGASDEYLFIRFTDIHLWQSIL